MIFAGCGKSKAVESAPKDRPENAGESVEVKKTEDNVETEEKPEKIEEESKEESKEEVAPAGKSLAKRMTGKYSYHCSDENGNDEFYVMDVVPFGENLYAYCGKAMPENNEDLEAYSFWTSEFIPYDANEMKSTDGDKVTVNELRFSVMSNAGKYWDAGHKGTITLTDEGLVFDGFDHEGFLVPENDDSRLFLKDDRVENAFSYLKDDDTDGPEELHGLWMHSGSNNDLYLEFLGSNLYLYSKNPDHEVFYAAGGCDYHDGSLDFTGNMIENGGMPFEFTGKYKIDGSSLILELQGSDIPDLLSGCEDFRQVSESGVHVITMDEVELTSDSFGMFGGNQNFDELKRQDYYGVFVSSSKSAEACTPAINKLEEAGFAGGFTVFTPDFNSLNPEPYYAVATGLFISERDAMEALSEVKAAGFTDAYVKYAGSYTGDRYWYTMRGGEKIDVLKDGVMLSGVSLTIPYHTDGEPVTAYLIVTRNTVFDKSADPESFGNYEKGDTPYEWIVRNYNLMSDDPDQYQMYGPALSGVFEVGLDDNKIRTYYGSYWWD